MEEKHVWTCKSVKPSCELVINQPAENIKGIEDKFLCVESPPEIVEKEDEILNIKNVTLLVKTEETMDQAKVVLFVMQV